MALNRRTIIISSSLAVLLLAVTIILILALVVFKSSPSPTVTTLNAGQITGKTILLEDGTTLIHEFHNIKYAEAPVGALRFQPPVRRLVRREERVEAVDSRSVRCVQITTGEGSEDCLVLTVRTANVTAVKPVLVWIHGGALVRSSGMHQGYSWDAEVTGKVDAVTVNINYRLGFLGFSSVEELWDEEAGVYANNGIRDMIAALDWIQDNIAAFGGNPKSVTIIGESGGATAVLALVCSPLANNKFHAAIAQSPAPDMRFTHREGNTFQRYIVNSMGCNQTTAQERKQCLLTTPAEKFSLKHGLSVTGYGYMNFPMSYGEKQEVVGCVMVDGVVIETSPRKLSNAEFFPNNNLPIVMSNLAEETYKMSWKVHSTYTTLDQLRNILVPLFQNLDKTVDVVDQMMGMYSSPDPVTVFSRMTTDMRSTCPSNDVGRQMAKATNRKVYRLYINHTSLGLPSFHSYDSFAMFGYTDTDPSLPAIIPNNDDVKFGEKLLKFVKDLAKDKSLGDDWGVFPRKTMIYENSEEISRVTSDEPQKAVCEKLLDLDLAKYGWQN